MDHFVIRQKVDFFASLILRVGVGAIVDPGVHALVECCLCRSMTTHALPGASQ